MTIAKIKYPGINGLRAISIILVIFNHLSLHEKIFENLRQYVWARPLWSFLEDGHMGVNVFFVISGFLITSLLLQEEKIAGKVSLKNFYIRRTLRIFPAYYFLLLVYFVLQLAGFLEISGASWITAITYTKYFNWDLDWYTGHAWSLSVEEHYYLLWPLLFIGGPGFRKKMAFALVILVPIIRTYNFYNPVEWINELTIFTRIDSIATGCLFALYKDEIVKVMSPHWHKLFFFSAISLFFLRYFPRESAKIHMDFIFIPLGDTHGSIANLLMAIILFYTVFGPQNLWHKFLNSTVINFIGLLSYSIYLWQQFFTSGSDYWVADYPQNLVFILAMSIFSYYVIEKPFLKLKTKF